MCKPDAENKFTVLASRVQNCIFQARLKYHTFTGGSSFKDVTDFYTHTFKTWGPGLFKYTGGGIFNVQAKPLPQSTENNFFGRTNFQKQRETFPIVRGAQGKSYMYKLPQTFIISF